MKMGKIAFAKYAFVGGFIPIRVVQPVGRIEMFVPENRNFPDHSK
jgi:hypothetical protein